MSLIAKMRSTKGKTPQTPDRIAQAGRQIAREAELLKIQSTQETHPEVGASKLLNEDGYRLYQYLMGFVHLQ